ncbi:hypothetical protein BpHYR1_041749 [Brachionus plicatilis]|uniref:Uncharacterized protein n=1 Tax=Brachionus plicatilis TaxID=10195 RepID=A0A3M7RVT3_BRAPC|nr:hypothetical protein BpHYR1_041749 [Brachionus plicatilis]
MFDGEMSCRICRLFEVTRTMREIDGFDVQVRGGENSADYWPPLDHHFYKKKSILFRMIQPHIISNRLRKTKHFLNYLDSFSPLIFFEFLPNFFTHYNDFKTRTYGQKNSFFIPVILDRKMIKNKKEKLQANHKLY